MAIGYYIALGSGLVADCPGLRGRKNLEIYGTRKSREAKRNEDDSMPWGGPVPDSQK